MQKNIWMPLRKYIEMRIIYVSCLRTSCMEFVFTKKSLQNCVSAVWLVSKRGKTSADSRTHKTRYEDRVAIPDCFQIVLFNAILPAAWSMWRNLFVLPLLPIFLEESLWGYRDKRGGQCRIVGNQKIFSLKKRDLNYIYKF